MDPVSAGLGAVSLISGKNANDKARKDAKKAQKGSQALEQRAIDLWDVLFKRAQDADKSGTFDPEKRIAQLEKDTANYEARDAGNLAGALTTAGYRPGDSEIGVRQDAVKIKYRKFLDQMRDEIRTKSFFDQNAAYQAANPQYLQAGLQGNQIRGQQAQSQIQNPAGFLGSLLPGMGGGGSGGGSSSGGGAGFNIGTGIGAGVQDWSWLKNLKV